MEEGDLPHVGGAVGDVLNVVSVGTEAGVTVEELVVVCIEGVTLCIIAEESMDDYLIIMLLPTFFLLHGVVNADGEERFDARAERVVHLGVRTGVT